MSLGRSRKLTESERIEREREFSEWSSSIEERINAWKEKLPSEIRSVLDKSIDSLIVLEIYLNATYPNSSFFYDLANANIFDAVSTYIGEVYRLHLPGSENLEWKKGTEIIEWTGEPRYRFYFQVGFREDKEGVNPSVRLPYILHTKPGKELFTTLTGLISYFQKQIEEKSKQKDQFLIPGRGGYCYQHFLLLKSDSYGLKDLEKSVSNFYAKRPSGPKVYLANEARLVVEFTKEFCFHFWYDDRPNVVAAESKEIAEGYNGKKDKAVIAACKSRIEFWGDSDPNGEYFNEHLFILSEIVDIPDILVFNFKQGVFYDEM